MIDFMLRRRGRSSNENYSKMLTKIKRLKAAPSSQDPTIVQEETEFQQQWEVVLETSSLIIYRKQTNKIERKSMQGLGKRKRLMDALSNLRHAEAVLEKIWVNLASSKTKMIYLIDCMKKTLWWRRICAVLKSIDRKKRLRIVHSNQQSFPTMNHLKTLMSDYTKKERWDNEKEQNS